MRQDKDQVATGIRQRNLMQCFKNPRMQTAKQRLLIYQRAIAFLNDETLPGGSFFLCEAIGRSRSEDYSSAWISESEMERDFPEVWKYKPKRKHSLNCWFQNNNKKSRIAILQKAIREVKKQIKK